MSLILAISGVLHALTAPSVQFTAESLGGTLQVGTAFSGSVTATNQGGATGTITYGATGLPAGLTINTATGAITGTPTASGTFSASITATNGTQSATPYAWSGTVAASAAFSLSGTLPATATVGTAYSGTLTLGGTFTAPVTIGAASGTIPAWMAVSVSGSTVTFSGTPASGDVATDSFTPKATDSSATPQVATGSAQSVVVSAASAGNFSDNFSTGASDTNWAFTYLGSVGTASITTGAMTLKPVAKAVSNVAAVHSGTYNSVTATLSLAANPGTLQYLNIAIGSGAPTANGGGGSSSVWYSGLQSGYVARLSSNGAWQLGRVDGANTYTQIGVSAAGAFAPTAGVAFTAELSIGAAGAITLSINGTLIASATDTHYTSGSIGILQGEYSNGVGAIATVTNVTAVTA